MSIPGELLRGVVRIIGVPFTSAQVEADTSLFTLSQGQVIQRCWVKVTTAFGTVTVPTLDIGVTSSVSGFLQLVVADMTTAVTNWMQPEQVDALGPLLWDAVAFSPIHYSYNSAKAGDTTIRVSNQAGGANVWTSGSAIAYFQIFETV